jgi:two-component system phosphate regulon response regulator PhoB
LSFLAERPNQVHSRHDLLTALGKHSSPINERTTDVWMKRLRSGLKEVGIADALRTVRQHGYAFELPAPRRSSSRV